MYRVEKLRYHPPSCLIPPPTHTRHCRSTNLLLVHVEILSALPDAVIQYSLNSEGGGAGGTDKASRIQGNIRDCAGIQDSSTIDQLELFLLLSTYASSNVIIRLSVLAKERTSFRLKGHFSW